MTVTLRPVFNAIPVYHPGESPEEETGDQLIKLSSNELPWPPSPALVDTVTDAFATLNRYPDFYKQELSSAIADYLGTDNSRVFIDNGSGTLLQDLVRLVVNDGDEVVFGSPSFAAYDIDVMLAGGVSIKVSLNDEWTYDLAACEQAITDRTRMVLLCNPNNPTGTFLTTSQIRSFLNAVSDKDLLVVVDEAYRDFVTVEEYGESMRLVDEFDNVVLLRTFSKAFGLAGLRLGYGIASTDVADAVNKVVAEFSVSTISQAVGTALLSDARIMKDLADKRDEIKRQRDDYQNFLSAAGVDFIPSQTNFIMIQGDPESLFARFRAQGLIVRPFADSRGIRITVGTREQMDIAKQVWS